MNYVCYEIDEDPEGSLNWYERLEFKLFKRLEPRLNPDFNEKYNDVIYWWLELNSKCAAVREIGFNSNGVPIVIGPYNKNRGIFTQQERQVQGFYPIEMYQFVEQWEYFLEQQAGKT